MGRGKSTSQSSVIPLTQEHVQVPWNNEVCSYICGTYESFLHRLRGGRL